MGYELHITRREHWADTETPDISINEWLAYVNSDNELELTNGYAVTIDQKTISQHRPGFCEWSNHPSMWEPHTRPWLDYCEGNIDTKNPDVPTIRKMIQIASALRANVQGDDGEIYTNEYLDELEEADKQKVSLKQRREKPWWRFW